MNGTLFDTISPEADAYLKEVGSYLGAVPADERDEILDDLAEHLREISAESSSVEGRLGSAKSYADELLASAGYATAAASPALLLRAASLAGRTSARLRESFLGREGTRLRPALRPAWWILRAYLTVSLMAALLGRGRPSFPGFPVPHLLGSSFVGLVAVIIAVPVSVRLGQRRTSTRMRRLLAVGVNLVILVYGGFLLARVGRQETISYVYPGGGTTGSGCLTDASGQNITNVYAYSPDGTLLSPVLLYDQNGQPIENLCPDFDNQGRPLSTSYAQDVNGAPVYNAFPRAQTVPSSLGGAGADVPVTPPAVVIPRLAPTTTLPAGSSRVTTEPAAAANSPATTVPAAAANSPATTVPAAAANSP
ncbi:MAG TPA: hypothetical protein VGR90_10560, partial [Acidimicrobiales bacterium]|nr:hypothetical protein [Acidimicrobiales bacterium]